jgi:hypothetical protein
VPESYRVTVIHERVIAYFTIVGVVEIYPAERALSLAFATVQNGELFD